MPMWCSSSDTPRPGNGISQPHHRIVRIPPGESVVLNSAERAPYLLLMEILNDDLDFDPARRSNKEVLKRIVAKENEKKGASRELISFNTTPYRHKSVPDPITAPDSVLGEEMADEPSAIPPIPLSSLDMPGEEEEIDLVEQLYGANQSLRQPIDLSESIVLPPAPKNRDLDMVTWSRNPSIPPSPSTDQHASLNIPSTPALIPASRSSLPPSRGSSTSRIMSSPAAPVLSLDEYSERMRTAAVMLAQLNANLVRESIAHIPITSGMSGNVNPPQAPSSASGSLSWIPGSSWLGNSSGQANSGDPLHPSLAGGQPENAGGTSAAATRMRVQHSEAAAIRDRIMAEMLALEEERMERMRENREGEGMVRIGDVNGGMKSEDEGIIRRELNRVDPSAVVFSESWAAKKASSTKKLLSLHSNYRLEPNTAWLALRSFR